MPGARLDDFFLLGKCCGRKMAPKSMTHADAGALVEEGTWVVFESKEDAHRRR